MADQVPVLRREMLAWVLAGALAITLVGQFVRSREDAPSAAEDPAIAQAQSAVTNLYVRDSAGTRLPLAPTGTPAILMVNSRTCVFCKQALMEIAKLQGSDDVPQLRVITLEGEAVGRSMLAALGVRGAFTAGPEGESEQVLLTFRIPGTPVFARTDARGRIVETVAGNPGRKVLARWLPVMRGQP